MKSQFFRLFSLLVILAMLATPVSARPAFKTKVEPAGTGEANNAGADSAPKLEIERKGVFNEVRGATDSANYFILLQDPPLARYRGGVNGLEATSPRATGAKKLDVKSPASLAYLKFLDGQQARSIENAEKALGRKLEVLFHYRYALNGIAARLTPQEAAKVAQMPGVGRVSRETIQQVDTDAGPTWIGASGIWDGSETGGLPGTMGEGIIVGDLDTGINSDHPSFADVGGDGYDHTNPFGAGVYVGVCDPANPDYDPTFVCNDKLIGGWDFVYDVTIPPDFDNPTPEDEQDHGSHTASTTAGNVVDAALLAPTLSYTKTISGVAPHANIIAYDVCYLDYETGLGLCPGTSTTAAADQAVADGVDVINFSIGGGTDPYNDDTELAFLGAFEAGVFVSTSAGNTGPGATTTGHRSPWVSASAAATHNRVFLNALTSMTGGLTTPPADTIGKGFTSGYGPAPIVFAGNYGDRLCPLGAFPAGTWTNGEIVVCDRGTWARVDKAQSVADGGAGGFVLANSASTGNSLNADAYAIPGVHITYNDGVTLKAWIADGGTDHMATIAGMYEDLSASNGDILASFSSRGPNGTLDVLNPKLTTPGVDIWAAYGTRDPLDPPEYGLMSGTSMSSPHTAGAAALLSALRPGWSPAEMLSALQMTADQTVLKEDGVTPAGHFDMGAGRVQVNLAGLSGLVMDETAENFTNADPAIGGEPRALNIATVTDSKCLLTCSWTRTFKSTLSSDATYTATITSDAGLTLTITPTIFTIPAGGTQDVLFAMDVSGLASGTWGFGDVTFETDALHPSTALFSENFEGTFPPAGWQVVDNIGNGKVWNRNDVLGVDNQTWNGGGSGFSAAADASPDAEFNAWDTELWSPPIDLSGTVSPTLSFASNFQDYATNGDAYLDVSTDGGTNWTNLYSQTTDDPGGTGGGGVLRTFDLSAYAGQTIMLRWRYVANDLNWCWFWQIDTVFIQDASVTGADVPDVHIPVSVLPTVAVFPDEVEILTRRNAGSQVVSGLEAIEITDLTIEVFGLTQGTLTTQELSQDATNGDPYDNFNDGTTFVALVTVPTDTLRLIAEITASEAPDIDLFVGKDDNGNGLPASNEQDCVSAGGTAFESCVIDAPAAGTYWILVQNWAQSPNAPDTVTLSSAVVPASDSGNMTVTGPTSVPAGDLFDLTLFWDTPEMMAGDRWYGAFSVGTDAANPGNLGTIPVFINRYDDDVTKTVDNPNPAVGDTVEYTITVQPNVTEVDLAYTFTDTIPTGLSYVPGSATATIGTVDVTGNTLTWNGVMPAGRVYVVTDSNADPACAAPLANDGVYVDLEQYGFLTNPTVFGDNVTFTDAGYGGNPYQFFGAPTADVALNFTDNGYVFFNPSTADYGANTDLPNPAEPNNLLAILWRDMEIVYDAATNKGVTTGIQLTCAGVPCAKLLEFDDVQVTGVPTQTLDFEMFINEVVDDTPGGFELGFAYTNVSPDLQGDSLGTIGVENGAGTLATTYAFNDVALSANMAVCFDWTFSPTPAVITYQATVDEGTEGQTLTNNVVHNTDNPGSMEASTSVDVTVPEVMFMYHDLEDVVHEGEDVWLVGEFTDWLIGPREPITMTANADYSVFTATISVAGGDYQYKYFVPSLWDWANWDMLNSSNRTVNVSGNMTVHDYRNVSVGWAHLGDPTAVTILLGESTGDLVGEVYIANVTTPAGEGRGVKAQLGYGVSSDPATWTWVDMTYTGDNWSNDLFAAALTPTEAGTFNFGVRFGGNWGVGNPNAGWTNGDRTGVLTVNSFSFTLAPEVAAGEGEPGDMVTYTLTLTNSGNTTDTLDLTTEGTEQWPTHLAAISITLASGESESFEVHVTIPVTATEGMSDTVNVIAASQGDPNKAATSTLTTTVVIADDDNDGVDDDIENGAPNGGDGNGDGIPDSQQANVTSLPNSTQGDYITLEAPEGISPENVTAITNPSPSDAPSGYDFGEGFLGFSLANVPISGAVTVTLTFHSGEVPFDYWKYGPTPDNSTPHWYEFMFDGTTGAEINGNVITLHFVDGLRGDSDLIANGVIVDPGAPATLHFTVWLPIIVR